MSYYLEVYANSVAPTIDFAKPVESHTSAHISKDDEVRLYLFLKSMYSQYPKLDDIYTEDESEKSIWGNDVVVGDGRAQLIMVFSKVSSAAPLIQKTAKKCGLNVFNMQEDKVTRNRALPLTAAERSLYPKAHQYLTELTQWFDLVEKINSKFGKTETEMLESLAKNGSGPAKRMLAFSYSVCSEQIEDKNERAMKIRLAHQYLKDIHDTAYGSRRLERSCEDAAKRENIDLSKESI